MAEAGREQAGHGLPGGDAAQWPLQRYARFMPSGPGEPPGPGRAAGTDSPPTWKVRPAGRKDREVLTPAGRENCAVAGQALRAGWTGGGDARDWQK